QGLVDLGGSKELHTLDLSCTDITDRGVKCFTALRKLRRLDIGQTQELHLNQTAITDRGIASLQPLTQLQLLDLAFCNLTDVGAEGLRELKQLRTLNLC